MRKRMMRCRSAPGCKWHRKHEDYACPRLRPHAERDACHEKSWRGCGGLCLPVRKARKPLSPRRNSRK